MSFYFLIRPFTIYFRDFSFARIYIIFLFNGSLYCKSFTFFSSTLKTCFNIVGSDPDRQLVISLQYQNEPASIKEIFNSDVPNSFAIGSHLII